MNKNKLLLEQLDTKIKSFSSAALITPPPTGWIKAVRISFGMTLKQLANKLSITKQSVQDLEKREKEGAITLKTLKDVANALDMKLVYGFVPKDGTLDNLLDRKARELAVSIVSKTSNTMKLEDQGNSQKRLKKAIEDRTTIIKNEMPKMLWD